MDDRPRLALILPRIEEPWRAYNVQQGFGAVARQAAGAGWRVDMISAPGAEIGALGRHAGVELRFASAGGVPVLAGPGSTSATRSLRDGVLVWRDVRAQAYDLILAPLTGGLLQPCLMSRACGESLANTRLALWAEPSSAERMRADATAVVTPKPLVDDALERAAVNLADAVIGPTAERLLTLTSFGLRPEQAMLGCLPAPEYSSSVRGRSGQVGARQLMFVGPGSTAYGADRFLAAIERLAASDPGAFDSVVFAGPWRKSAPGISKMVLGLRAKGWGFPFELMDTSSPAEILKRVEATGMVVVFAGGTTDDEVLVQQARRAGAALALTDDHSMAKRLDGAALILPTSLSGLEQAFRVAPATVEAPSDDWAELLDSIRRRPSKLNTGNVRASAESVSICVTHKDRAVGLARALASVAHEDPERVVADAGSVLKEAQLALVEAEAAGAKVLRLGPIAQGLACDSAARAARGDVLIFLDDDNVFIEDGCARLARAVGESGADIVVSSLALYDGQAGVGPPAAHLGFLGEAGSAGLLFNGFGDMSFAIRRAAFLDLGGFGEYDGAGLDWVFLARAREQGLTIRVLQQPAVGYARQLAATALKWRKCDQEGVRSKVLACYEKGFNSDLLARLAQDAYLGAFYP